MHGLGDNIRSRAMMRDLINADYYVTLSTPWPSVFHDFVATRRMALSHSKTNLRTQMKNEAREIAAYSSFDSVNAANALHIQCPPPLVRRHDSLLAAMYLSIGMNPLAAESGDFTLTIPIKWMSESGDLLGEAFSDPRPILVFRPLQARKEWGGWETRNPDFDAYSALYARLRPYFCVVSVADLEDGEEWLVGNPFEADYYFHKGELSFQSLAVLYQAASLVYCAPGFSAVLAQAVGTPYVLVFGGYEKASYWPHGKYLPRALHIEPINPCPCFEHKHACDKRIDMESALLRLDVFLTRTVGELDAVAA